MSLVEAENPVGVHSRGVWGHVPPEILGVLRCILVHSEAYREAHREEAHHQNHHCLLSYWNTGNHLFWLGSIYTISLLSIPIHRNLEVQRQCCAARNGTNECKVISSRSAAVNFF